MRIVYCCLGFLCVVIALIGAVLPLLPAIVFWALAGICFGKAFPRLKQWFQQTRFYTGFFAFFRGKGKRKDDRGRKAKEGFIQGMEQMVSRSRRYMQLPLK